MKWNRDGRKKELWEQDKTTIQRFVINAKIKIAKYNRQTHGLGILFILIVVVLVVINIIPYVIPPPKDPEAEEMERIVRCLKMGSCIWGL